MKTNLTFHEMNSLFASAKGIWNKAVILSDFSDEIQTTSICLTPDANFL